MSFTVRQFTMFLSEIGTILKMETGGSSKRKSGSIEMTNEMALKMFGRKKTNG